MIGPVRSSLRQLCNQIMRLAPRICSQPGCGKPAQCRKSRCMSCERLKQKMIDARRASAMERGYDKYHKHLRILCFMRDHWTCVDCGWMPDTLRDCIAADIEEPPIHVMLAELTDRCNRGDKHLHADHEIPIEDRPDLRLDLDNYRTRCNECHAAKTMRELNRGSHAKPRTNVPVPILHC
jgi:HNH endonuclease